MRWEGIEGNCAHRADDFEHPREPEMKIDILPQGALSRRQLLKGAVSTAAVASASSLIGRGSAQAGDNLPASRIRESFDFDWKFSRGDFATAQLPEFSDKEWATIALPHDWSIEGPFDQDHSSSYCGGYLPTGIGWYRKHFRVPESYKDRKLTIEFDGVYQNSQVWINGRPLGNRPYGYVPFFYDLTPHIDFGKENVIAVKVDNSRQTNCRWYSGSGIYRRTWLIVTGKIHVAQWGTFVTTPEVSTNAASVRVSTRIQNEGKAPTRCTVVSSILDRDGAVVQTAEQTEEIPAGKDFQFAHTMKVDKPHLWSVESPYLYRLLSTLRASSEEVDHYATPIGIRQAVFDADRGFLLNGERVKLRGVCLHHDGGCLGAAVPERVWERRLEILREMGCNAVRTSHNPFAAEFLDLCDQMGFLVLNEAFDEWKVPKTQIGPNGYSNYFDEWYERDVQNFVRRDRNHPSVVLWSAGNEIGDQQAPNGAETLSKLLKIFHTEDPTRPVTAGCDHIQSEPASETARPEFLALLDVVGYNYADRWRDRREKYYSIDRHSSPERRFIGTESEAIAGIRGEYPELFTDTAPVEFGPFSRGHNVDVEQLFKFVTTYDYVAGDFMWTGIDHLGEARWPMKGSSTGVIDTCGFKKDGFYFYQSQWVQEPVLHVFPHWNWQRREGQIIPVSCYTNCDTVELFVNGRSMGVKGYEFPRLGMELHWGNLPERAKVLRTTADLHLSWDVPYEPGALRAVGTKGGKVVSTIEVPTTGEPAAIQVSADRGVIRADGRDVVHFAVQILDERGSVVRTAKNELEFELVGEGRLIGLDSGDPASHEDYRSNRRRAFNGLALAIAQSTKNPGQIQLRASSPSLRPATARVVTIQRDQEKELRQALWEMRDDAIDRYKDAAQSTRFDNP
jgi:beta-galactosidase